MSNAAAPSCSAGTPENDAVNGTPRTVAETASPSGLPPAQTAFVSVHARAGSRMAMAPDWLGVTVTSQPRLLPAVRRRALVTVAPVTASRPPATVE